jgi:dTMP kinase
LTLLIGGVLALAVSYYAASRATRSRLRLRDILRRRVMRTGLHRRGEHPGLFVSVDGVDAAATAGYTALLVAALHRRGLVTTVTAEPTDSPVGRRVAELLRGCDPTAQVEPETAALLSAADRAEHVAETIRPALERGEVVVCDGYVLTSLAAHGGGQGADVDRIRSINAWSTGDLLPDLSLVAARNDRPATPLEQAAETVRAALLEAADEDLDRCVVCPAEVPEALPADVLDRLQRLVDARASGLAGAKPNSSRGSLSKR